MSRTLRIQCETRECASYLSLEYDDTEPPKYWFCPTCLDHIEAQHAEELARRESANTRGRRIASAIFQSMTGSH